MTPVLRIISIDDHPAITDSLMRAAEQCEHLEMVGTFSSIESVPRPYRAAGAVADLAVLDLSLPGVGGITGVRTVVSWGLVVVAFTATANEQTARDVLDAGASAVVSKVVDTAQVLDAARRAARGERFTLGIDIANQIVVAPTPAEEFLLRCITTETRSSVLAIKTGVSIATVDNRISVLYDKVGLHQTDRTRAKLAEWARHHGYLSATPGSA
jgi:DNA-binding NarL/FixJ family response regulator